MLDTDLVKNPQSAKGVDKDKLPIITFEEEVYDFGDIKAGEKVTHKFKFTNTGKSDLIIGSARGSCGCTVPMFPTDPISPGNTGEIEVAFNSNGKNGFQNKTISVITNGIPATKVIAIKANVLTK